MLIALALVLGVAAQDKPADAEQGVRTGADPGSAVRILLTGHVDLHYVHRSRQVGLAASALNFGTPPVADNPNFWAGRIGLRADVEVKDLVAGVIELENRSYESGANRPFGADPTDSDVDIRQGYIEAGEFLTAGLNLRIGVQNVTFRNRPHDDPFFMDLAESESFFSGFQPGTPPGVGRSSVTNTADRDIQQPAGVRLFYSPVEIMTLQAFWMVVREVGATGDDESVYGVVANSLLGENWASWILFSAVSGGDQRLSTVWTVGAGVDGYVGASKELEVFAEVYGQGGTLTRAPAAVHKQAYAFNVGARGNVSDAKLWVEAALSRRSGDRRGDNDRDQAFQSYENTNRFLVMESSEFGLDIDTNVTCARMAVGAGPFDVSGRPLRLRADLGRFAAVAPVRSVSKQWGVESDLSAVWNYNESFSLSLKGAWLGDSQLLKRLSGDNHAWIALFGADLKF
jgi:hypothetical protein